MADEARLNEILDLIEQARAEGDTETEQRAIAAYRTAAGPPQETPWGANTFDPDAALGEAGKFLAEGAASSGTSLVNLVSKALGIDPRVANDYINKKFGYFEPGKISTAISESAPAKAIGGAVAGIDEKIGEVAGPAIQSGVREAASIVSDVANVGGATALLRQPATKAIERATRPNTNPPINSDVATAIERGWMVRPSDAAAASPATPLSDIPGSTRQGLRDPGELAMEFQRHNAAKATEMGGSEIGIDKAIQLTDENFNALRVPHHANYDMAGRAAGAFDDPTLPDRLNGIVRSVSPEDGLRQGVFDITKDYPSTMSGPELVQSIHKLRAEATRGLRSDVPNAQVYGMAKRQIADELEKSLAARLDSMGDAQIATAFRNSRQALAKIHNVEDSTLGGQIDPQAVRRLKDKGVPLTGGLDEIADMAGKFGAVVRHPKSTANPEKILHGGTARSMTTRLVGGAIGKMPGVNVARPGFQKKLAKETRAQQAERGGNFNKVTPVKPVESNQGRQADFVGDFNFLRERGELAAPGTVGSPARDFSNLGDQLTNQEPLFPVDDARPIFRDLSPPPGEVGRLLPADTLPPIPSSASQAQAKALRDHMIQVLAARQPR